MNCVQLLRQQNSDPPSSKWWPLVTPLSNGGFNPNLSTYSLTQRNGNIAHRNRWRALKAVSQTRFAISAIKRETPQLEALSRLAKQSRSHSGKKI